MNNNIKVRLGALEAREWAGTVAAGTDTLRKNAPTARKILERISKETGGRLFEVSKKQPIDQIYTSIAEELRNQYSIGYTPGPNVAPGYHKIHLTTKQKDHDRPDQRRVLLGSIGECGRVQASWLIYAALLLSAATCRSSPEGEEALHREGDLRR